MLNFRLDIFSWIPQPDVPNPIFDLPGGVPRWGNGACGPRFGGDNFVIPPVDSKWKGKTYRAMQTFAFKAESIGATPYPTINSGTTPGVTTVLTATRAANGRVCFSQTPTVTASAASVTWEEDDKWYEVKMHGAAHDPVPATAVSHALRPGGDKAQKYGTAASNALTPDLEWKLTFRFQSGTTIPFVSRLRYAFSSGLNLDKSAATFPKPVDFGASDNLVHGIIMVRRFPSYIVYATIDTGQRQPVTIPVYFANANSRALTEIVIGQHDPVRQLTW